MKVIGLTGGIASGKSTVSQHLANLGAEIIDADLLARKVVQLGEKAYTKVVRLFGKEILEKDGTINRRALAAKVFNNPEALSQLNEIIHPEVIRETQDRLAKADRLGVKVAVVDAPLLIEAKMTGLADEVWLVVISTEEQLRRAVERDKSAPEEIKARISSQMPLEEKKRYATRIIDNSGTMEKTYKQVEEYYKELIAE